eukprot:CAMPEP_0172452738 /NCGR_PEP_ID=MMETSP1065-20121228/10311_1 /TAXON_ID=265537 /ORGANISM="Amphiprora paludosa, Strain CCMP125" /LENGTH=285 /DNA_ID=CAMNT_0013204843 /DNA_START=77 /DNA_END=934 /DNA_ORIENTATION=+
MGNSIARDFSRVELTPHSHRPLWQTELIAPGGAAHILKVARTVLIRQDHARNSLIVFDEETMTPLYITSNKKPSSSKSSKRSGSKKSGDAVVKTVTKDSQGRVLFLTTAPNKNKRLIYKAPKLAGDNHHKGSTPADMASLDGQSEHSSSSFTAATATSSSSHPANSSSTREQQAQSGWSASCSARYKDNNLPCTAQIDLDSCGATTQAFLSLIVWNGQGPELRQVYKAVKIPQVKYGALIVEHETGQVVGKSRLDETRLEPMLEIAAGADVPSVVALTGALFGDF